MSEGKHKHHERVVHTHRTHVNNLNLSGFRGHSVSHAGRASKLKVLEQSGETVAVAVYLAQGERLLEEEVVDKDPITDISPPPPSTFEALTEGIGYDNPIVVQVPIPAGKTVHDLTVIDVLINMLDMQVGSYTFTDIITDSVHKFFEAMVISDGTDTNRYPDVLAETSENNLQGYFGFQYNEETGYLSGGKFQSFGAMYFRGKPNPLTVAPPVHSDDNDPIHGLGYPDLPPRTISN